MSSFKPRQMSNFAVFSMLCVSLGLAFFIPGIMMRLEMVPVPSPYLSVNLCPASPKLSSPALSPDGLRYHSSSYCGNLFTETKNLITTEGRNIAEGLQPKRMSAEYKHSPRVLLETERTDVVLVPKSELGQVTDSKIPPVDEKETPVVYIKQIEDEQKTHSHHDPIALVKESSHILSPKNKDIQIKNSENPQITKKNEEASNVLTSNNQPILEMDSETVELEEKETSLSEKEMPVSLEEEIIHELIIPLHDRMLVSNLEYVPVILIPHQLHGDGKIVMSLENDKGEKLFEVNQRLSSNNIHTYNSVVMTSPYSAGTKIQVYNPYHMSTLSQTSLEQLERKVSDGNTNIRDPAFQEEWCQDPIFGCPYEFENPMKELILLKSKFFLDSNKNEEAFVANLTLRVHDASISVSRKLKNPEFATSFIEMQRQTPALLLSFHQTSLSNIQRSGVGYIIRGIIILLATLALASSRAYLFPQHRHKDKEVNKENEIGGAAYCNIKNRRGEEDSDNGFEEDEVDELDEQEDYCDDDGEEEEQIQRELERAIREEEEGYIAAVVRARS